MNESLKTPSIFTTPSKMLKDAKNDPESKIKLLSTTHKDKSQAEEANPSSSSPQKNLSIVEESEDTEQMQNFDKLDIFDEFDEFQGIQRNTSKPKPSAIFNPALSFDIPKVPNELPIVKTPTIFIYPSSNSQTKNSKKALKKLNNNINTQNGHPKEHDYTLKKIANCLGDEKPLS